MFVVVTTEVHFYRTAEGSVWTQAECAYRFWKRYLEVFDGVRVIAHVRDIAVAPPESIRVDGPNVSVTAVPDYLGPWQYLRNRTDVCRIVQGSVGPEDAVILRAPSQLSNCLYPVIKASSRPYGIEVIGDPWDVFAQEW